ncbi:MAG: hypothetical protein V3T84_17155 [Phycisphaerales bacterium]
MSQSAPAEPIITNSDVVADLLARLAKGASAYVLRRKLVCSVAIPKDLRDEHFEKYNELAGKILDRVKDARVLVKELDPNIVHGTEESGASFLVNVGKRLLELAGAVQTDLAMLPEVLKVAEEPREPWMIDPLRNFGDDPIAATIRELMSKLSDDANTLASVPVRSATTPRVADPSVETIDSNDQPIPDPVGNAELTKLAGLHDADNVSRQIKDALREANKAVKSVGPGHDREWTHRNLQDAYANLPHGKLKKLLRQTGLANLNET